MAFDGGISLDGAEYLRRTLRHVSPAEGRRIARRTVTRVARIVRDATRDRAPVETGALRRSVKSRRAKGAPDEAVGEVYVDRSGGRTGRGYHWHIVEFGSRRQIPQPFVVPTVEEMRPRVPSIYQDEWWPQYRKEMVKRAEKQARRQRRARSRG